MSTFSPLDMIRQQQEENKYRTQVLDLREVAEHPKNDFPITQADIDKLADSIHKSGGVLQFPLVRLLSDGSFQMLAGHRRRRASILLGETIEEKYYRTMCYVLENISDEAAELYLIETNIQARELSPKLRAKKVADARNLIKTLKERGEIDVRSVRRAVAESTGMSESTVILQTRIAEKLDKDLMELYDQGAFGMRDAYEYSGLSPAAQEEILAAYLQDDLNEDELKKEIAKAMLQDKVGVKKNTYSKKEVGRKIGQAHKTLTSLADMREQGAQLDKDALRELKDLLELLLED